MSDKKIQILRMTEEDIGLVYDVFTQACNR